MKNIYRLLFWLVVGAAPSLVWADMPPSTGSTPSTTAAPLTAVPTAMIDPSTPTVYSSTSPAYTGETVSSPMPQGITGKAGEGVFVTLNRTAYADQKLPSSTEIITPDEVKIFDAQTAGDALARTAGVQTLPLGRLGSLVTARIRGSSSNQTLILIDGRPVGGTALGSQDLSEIPIEQIDHIEILRGGASALYGPNAMGGVINIISKRATHPGLPISNVSYEQGSYGQQVYRLDAAGRNGPLDYVFYGNQEWESGFRDNSDARTHNIGGNMGVAMGRGGKFLFDGSSYHADAGQPGELFPDLPTNQYNNALEKVTTSPNARQTTDTNYLRTSYLLPLPMNSLMTLRLFGSQREADYTDPDNFVNSDRFEQSHGGEAQFSLPYGLLVGGNFIHDREDSIDQITPTNTFVHFVENYGLFAQETFNWNVVTLIPSGRFDHNSTAGDSTNPRVQTMVDATPWLRFSASAARSFRAPTIDDLYYPFTDFGGGFSYQGNPLLKPEHAWTYDGGFEVHIDSYSLRATYFRANVTDLIQTTTDPASTTENIGSARRQGMELAIKHVVNQYFRDEWNYTYLENRGIPVGYSDYVTLPYSPKHTANYVATITPVSHLSLSTTLRYEDTRWSDNDETGTKLGSMIIWDSHLSYQWRQLEIFLGFNDMTNRRYEEQAGYPLAGHTGYGGVRLHLWG